MVYDQNYFNCSTLDEEGNSSNCDVTIFRVYGLVKKTPVIAEADYNIIAAAGTN
jgi:hypothetical protein